VLTSVVIITSGRVGRKREVKKWFAKKMCSCFMMKWLKERKSKLVLRNETNINCCFLSLCTYCRYTNTDTVHP